MSRFQGVLKLEVESDSDRQQWRETLCILDTKERCLRVYHPDRKQLIRSVSIEKDTRIYDVANSKSLRIQWFSFYIVFKNIEEKENGEIQEAQLPPPPPPTTTTTATTAATTTATATMTTTITESATESSTAPAGSLELILYFAAASTRQKANWLEALCSVVNEAIRVDYITRHKSLPLHIVHQPEVMVSKAAFFYSEKFLKINYNRKDVKNGSIMKPSMVKNSPGVRFQFPIATSNHGKDRYSLIMLDLDAHASRGHTTVDADRFYLCWCILNMEEEDFAKGKEVVKYESPAPNLSSGLHRYLFILFRHTAISLDSKQDGNVTKALHILCSQKERFPYLEWATLMGFNDPIASTGFYAGWESYHCDDIHNSLGYMPPEQYRSPNQVRVWKHAEQTSLFSQTKMDVYASHGLSDVFPFSREGTGVRASDAALLTITLDNTSASLHSGVTLLPSKVQVHPKVTIILPVTIQRLLEDDLRLRNTGSNVRYYTLLLTDPDTPSALKPSQRESVHWVVINIPDGDVSAEEATEVLSYQGPAPMYASGSHRLVMTLFEQSGGKMSDWDLFEAQNYFASRLSLQTHSWVLSMHQYFGLCVPLSLFVFLTEWEEAVDEYHLKQGLMPPARFRSPRQAAKNLQQSKERTISRRGSGSANNGANTVEEVDAASCDSEAAFTLSVSTSLDAFSPNRREPRSNREIGGTEVNQGHGTTRGLSAANILQLKPPPLVLDTLASNWMDSESRSPIFLETLRSGNTLRQARIQARQAQASVTGTVTMTKMGPPKETERGAITPPTNTTTTTAVAVATQSPPRCPATNGGHPYSTLSSSSSETLFSMLHSVDTAVAATTEAIREEKGNGKEEEDEQQEEKMEEEEQEEGAHVFDRMMGSLSRDSETGVGHIQKSVSGPDVSSVIFSSSSFSSASSEYI